MMRVAFKILFHDRAKYLALVLGITFSTLLISQQTSIFWSVLISTTQPIRMANAADIWVMKPNVEFIDASDPMPEIYVNRVRSVGGVAWAVPYYRSMATLKTPDGLFKTVSLVGVDDRSLTGSPSDKMVLGQVTDLLRPDAVIMDIAAYLRFFPGRRPRTGDTVEVGGVRGEIVGLCKVPPGWDGLGTLYAKRSLALAMAHETVNPVTFVLAKAAPGVAPETVSQRIGRQTGLAAHSQAEFSRKTIEWFLRYSGVAENFGITILLGFFIGTVIVGQTFYMFSRENLTQFAALKAIGVRNRTILAMLLAQASFVAVVGFCLGIGCSSLFFSVFSPADSGGLRGAFMALEIVIGTGIFVLGMTLGACLVSVRSVLVVDPALVFRG